MSHRYRYFALATKKQPGHTLAVLRRDGEREEIFVAAEGWRPSHAADRAELAERQIDEGRARLLIDATTANRFMPLDRPFRYFAVTDGEHTRAVVRRWADEHGDHEEVLVSLTKWAPSTEDSRVAVPIDAVAVDRFAAILEEREKGYEFHHYFAIVDAEHGAEDPVTVVRERPATGEVETYGADLRWKPGLAEGERVPITASHAFGFVNSTMPERVREANPYRYYAILTVDHPDVAAPEALVRQHICVRCLPGDEMYRPGGRWVRTNAAIAIRAGERPGRVVPITSAAAEELLATWTPAPAMDREPAARPLYNYYALADDPLTVVRVHGVVEEIYTSKLLWEKGTVAGERVPISALDALRFEETQFCRVFGEAQFQYYAAVTLFYPDPEDPAAVVRAVTDDLGVTARENHGPGGQWTHAPWNADRVLVPVAPEKAAQLREICDSRSAEPLYYYQSGPDTLSRYWDELGTIRKQSLKNGMWRDASVDFKGPHIPRSAHFLHPVDIVVAQRFQAECHDDPPQCTHYAIIDAEHPLRDPVALIRAWPVRGEERVEEYGRSSGYARWEPRTRRPDGDAVELTESLRHRLEKRSCQRFRNLRGTA